MPQEPELAHPSFSRRASNTSAASSSSKASSAEKAHAKSLRNAGKEVRAPSADPFVSFFLRDDKQPVASM